MPDDFAYFNRLMILTMGDTVKKRERRGRAAGESPTSDIQRALSEGHLAEVRRSLVERERGICSRAILRAMYRIRQMDLPKVL